MLRHIGSRALSVPARLSQHTRNIGHFPISFWRPTHLDRHFDWMDREMERAFRSPFWSSTPFSRPLTSLDSTLPPLIVNDGGASKFRVDFDVSKFTPEEVKVTTTASDSTLRVEAKHEDDTCSYQFSRVITIPKGAKIEDLKCTFTSNGTLSLEAPYEAPPEEKKELPKETPIQITHN